MENMILFGESLNVISTVIGKEFKEADPAKRNPEPIQEEVVRFRRLVAQPLMAHYFRGARGWRLVGYSDYPLHVSSDANTGEVIDLVEDGGQLFLQLADDTLELYEPENRLDDQTGVDHLLAGHGLGCLQKLKLVC